MKLRHFAAIGALALLGCASSALALAGTHGKGDPKRPISASSWPKGIIPLANQENRISGHFVNASDWFQYEGDAKAFNKFVADYAKVEGTPHMLMLKDPDEGFTGAFPVPAGYAWEMSITGWSHGTAALTLPLGGKIKVSDIQVPLEVSVGYLGTKYPEAKKFADEHERKREAAKKASDTK